MNSQLLLILLLATVAGIILFRLYSVLGRRTGQERPPQDRFERLGALGKTSAALDEPEPLPDRGARQQDAGVDNAAPSALTEIASADRSFTPEHFLAGARRAYEMIVTAFACNDRDTLRPLLHSEVYAAFDRVMTGRDAEKQNVQFTFVGFRDVKITDASLAGFVAEITVSFAAQFISSTLNADGGVIEGDSTAVQEAVDVWVFERNVRASDPNWQVVATSGEAGLQEL